jgi:hypothetical protein
MDKFWSRPTTHAERRHRERLLGLLSRDMADLYQIGMAAAQRAGVRGFWIDTLCMDAKHIIKDAHRICDVVRGAKAMVIALKEPVDARLAQNDTEGQAPKAPAMDRVDEMLVVWGSRLWTLPELLLAPNPDIEVWVSNTAGLARRRAVSKRNMASTVYTTDGHMVRQLLDHFDNTLNLTHTELLTIGLQCLVIRLENTKGFAGADLVYALMTLARRRPEPNDEDSMFEAFAKLSLLNDADRLLERLICFLPPARGQPWYIIEDYWKVKLWDIFPTCQIAGIAADQTVILDGAFGASIVWDHIPRVAFLKRYILWRILAEYAMRLAPGWLILAISMIVAYKPKTLHYGSESFTTGTNPGIGAAVVFLLLAVTIIALLPATLLSKYSGKFWSTQAWFIGIEGAVDDLDDLERRLFGFSNGRIKWSPYSSTQSRHQLRSASCHLSNECEGVEPSKEPLPLHNERVGIMQYNSQGRRIPSIMPAALPDAANDQANGINSKNNSSTSGTSAQIVEPEVEMEPDRLFTLIDTYTLTVTTFRAVHPPSAVLICGREGGAQRALLCSYDFRTQTFHRETVLRMQTNVLNRLDRVERFRFSMESMPLVPKEP